jgi:hypothetical protein
VSAAKAGAPGSLKIDDVGPNSMALSWNKPWNDGGSPVKGKKIQFIGACVFLSSDAPVFRQCVGIIRTSGNFGFTASRNDRHKPGMFPNESSGTAVLKPNA